MTGYPCFICDNMTSYCGACYRDLKEKVEAMKEVVDAARKTGEAYAWLVENGPIPENAFIDSLIEKIKRFDALEGKK